MNFQSDLSFISMVTHASVVVQSVIALLFLFSLWSWWQIFLKLFGLRRAATETDRFEDEFWKGGDLNELFQRASHGRRGALERIFSAGFREYAKHRRQGSTGAATMDSTRRAMRASYQRETDALEANLAGLATVGSVSPYIGLFGTVLGIVRAFRNLGADLAEAHAGVMTALAEALVATAIGLLVAIPAVVAFNAFKNAVKARVTRAETLSRTLLSRLKGEVPAAEPQGASLRAAAE